MKNTVTIIAVVVIVVLVFGLLGSVGMMGLGGFGMMGGYGGYGGMMGSYGGFGFNPVGWVLSLIFWALIIGGAVLLILWLVRNVNGTSAGSLSNSAIEILKARYARGEITKEQFDSMKRDLQ